MNRGGRAVLYGGDGGNNTLIHAGPSDGHFDMMDGGAGPNDVCIILGGDEIIRCNDGPFAPPTPHPTTPIGAGTPPPPGSGDPPGPVPPPGSAEESELSGYWILGADGTVDEFGDAEAHSMPQADGQTEHVHIEPTSTAAGYWIVDAQGGVSSFGDARFLGEVQPGSFGDAPFKGSMAGTALNAPVTGMAAHGNGYLLVAEDGGVFNFSDQRFQGSLTDRAPARSVVSIASVGLSFEFDAASPSRPSTSRQ